MPNLCSSGSGRIVKSNEARRRLLGAGSAAGALALLDAATARLAVAREGAALTFPERAGRSNGIEEEERRGTRIAMNVIGDARARGGNRGHEASSL